MTNTRPDDRESLVGADIDRAWRALSREEPAASVDASILAAAHRKAGARPQSVDPREARAMRRRWWPLAAAATVAAVAVGVLQLTPQEDIGAPSQHATVSDMPAPPAKKNDAAPAAPALQDNAGPSTGASGLRAPSEAPRIAAMPRQAPAAVAPDPKRQRTEARPAPPASPAPEPFPAAPNPVDAVASASAGSQEAPMARKEMAAPPAATGNLAAERASQAPASAAVAAAPDARKAELAASPAAPLAKMSAARADEAAGAARVKDRAPLPIPDWIALIRRLRAEGKTVEAAKELAAFRAAHTDHEKLLPPDLRDWHPPEK